MVLIYPEWITKHLTPKIEVTDIINPGEVELYFDPRQSEAPYPTGYEVYESLKDSDMLNRALSFGELKWFEDNPGKIPADFNKKLIYGWASVSHYCDGNIGVPYLDCRGVESFVEWYGLHFKLRDCDPAGLRKH